MRQPVKDVVMDSLMEELGHLKICLSMADDPYSATRDSGENIRKAIVEMERRVAQHRREMRA